MKRLMKALFILALIFCFAMPAFAIKILPYDVPLQDLMKWDKSGATLKLSNPEGETLSVAWASTVDLWNYDGATWTFDLPSGDTFAFGKGIAVTGISSITGATTITGTFGVTGAVTITGTVGVSGLITSTSITGFRSNPTFIGDLARTNYALAIGTRAAALTVTIGAGNDQDLDPIQLNLLVAGVNPGNSSTLNASYMLITHNTAMTNMRLKCSDWNVVVSADIKDAYVYQGEIDITASTAIGGEACVLGLTMSVSAGTVTGLVRGLVILMSGASMPANAAAVYVNVGGGATLTHGLLFATQGGTTLTNAIYIEQGGTVTNILKFDATSATVVSTATGGATRSYKIRCAVGGVTGWLSLYTD
uniref:Uncharacterized protein n=2 Tax=viral metagenome TaxID=1070528 RepID=A0A6M3XWQ5_9ZZZZ